MSDAVPIEQPTGEPAPILRPEEAPKQLDRPLARVPENVGLRKRFAVAYLVLAALLGAGVGLAVVFLSSDDSNTTFAQSRWSEWQPIATGTLGVREIAREIAPRYRLANGQQFVGVVAGPMAIRTSNGPIPVSALLISSGVAGVNPERVDIEFPEAGVFFQMCGTAAACGIPNDGSPVRARGQLMRREALELSLYTFHYLPQADHVVTFLPPPPGVQPTEPEFQRVLYLTRTKVAPLLRVPLSSALPPGTATLEPRDISPQQGTVIDDFTGPQVYHYELQRISDLSAIMQLSPLEP